MRVAEHQSILELRRLEKAEPDARRRLRLRAIVLAKRGKTAEELVQALGLSRRAVQRTIERYNAEGLAVLNDRKGRGRKPKVDADKVAKLKARLDAGPAAADGVATFTGRYIQGILDREFNVLYSLNGVYELLRREGYSWLVPRPRHENADPAAQAEFKKKSRP